MSKAVDQVAEGGANAVAEQATIDAVARPFGEGSHESLPNVVVADDETLKMNMFFRTANGFEHFWIGFVAGDQRLDMVFGECGVIGEQGIKRAVEFALEFILGGCAREEVVPVGAWRGFLRSSPGLQEVFLRQEFPESAIRYAIDTEREIEQRPDEGKGPCEKYPEDGGAGIPSAPETVKGNENECDQMRGGTERQNNRVFQHGRNDKPGWLNQKGKILGQSAADGDGVKFRLQQEGVVAFVRVYG